MTQLKDSQLLRALTRQAVEYTPIWIMRQAGRYLPEYRRVRELAGSFLKLCQTPELACEVTLQPLRRFALDAAILFSDILVVPAAMGLELVFVEGEGPMFIHPVATEQDIHGLRKIQAEQDLAYVMTAIHMIKQTMPAHIPLIGFAGSPWTLACYMVQGRGSKDFSAIRKLMFTRADLLIRLLDQLTVAVADYLVAQVHAGVDVLMLFDTWGGLLSARHYQQFSLYFMQNIVKVIRQHFPERQIPIILFTKNGGQWLELIAASGCDAIGLDWHTDLQQARYRVGEKVALQGNLDPATLYGDEQTIRREVQRLLESYGKGPGHIFNLGHGITPDIEPAKVAILVDAVHEYSKA